MKSVSKPYRLAIFNALNGNVTLNGLPIKVYDELKSVANSDTEFVLLTTQTSQPDLYQGAFIRSASIDIEVITKFGSEVSKDDLDDIEESIINILFPDANAPINIVAPSGFRFLEGYYASERTITTMISQTETIVRKIITITTIITQQ